MDRHCPRAWRATMTEESSEVPRELTGKSGAAAGSPSAPAHPSPPPPCPPPPSRRSREVAAPLRSQPCWAGRRELCSRLAAWKAQSGEGGRGGRKRGAGCLGLGSSGSQEHPLQRPVHCPKLGEVRERPVQGRGGGGLASAQWVVSGTCPPPSSYPREVLLPYADSGEGALVWSADGARRGVALPSQPGAKGLQE